MFTHDCTACARTQLIFPSMFKGLVDTADGVAVRFVCWCGAPQESLVDRPARDGRRAGDRAAA